ncbi:hypothetical protein Tco_0667470 [Tanacetum coccineum]
MTAPSTSSTNDVNTANHAYEVSTVSPNINTVCPQVSTANFSDNTVNGFKVAALFAKYEGKKMNMFQTPNMGSNGVSDSENDVLFSEEVTVLKREVACKDYEINVLKSEFEKVKQEKEGIEFKIKKFDNASKSLDKLLESQITDKSKMGLGYNVVSKLESNIVCDTKSDDSKEISDDSLVKEQVSDDTSSFVESPLNVDKETVLLVDKKIEFVKPKNHENLVKKSVKYAEMYRSQSPRGNQRNWNGQKSNNMKLVVKFNKGCFICGSFNHVQINCNYHQREMMVSRNNYNRVDYDYYAKTTHPSAHRNMTPRAVLLKTVLTTHLILLGLAKRLNAVKTSAYRVWRPTRPNGASLVLNGSNYIDARGRSKSWMLSTWTSEHKRLLKNFKGIFDSGLCLHLGEEHIGVEFLVVSGTISNESAGTQGELNAGEDGSHNESDEKDKSKDDSSPKEVNVVGQHVNTDSPEIEPRSIAIDSSWVVGRQMQEELLQIRTHKQVIGKKKLLYGTIEEEVYVTQPPGFKDLNHPDKVYKVVKDKYIAEILKKFNYTECEVCLLPSAFYSVDLEKPLVKDVDAADVDVHLYKSMIGSLMYLIASRPDIMFACKKQTVVATSTTEAEYVAAAS